MRVLYSCQRNVEGTVLAFGNFDGVHLGHKQIFRRVKEISEELNVASSVLTFRPHTAVFLKGLENFLLLDFEQKVQLIESCGIDCLYVLEFEHNFAQLLPESFLSEVLLGGCGAKHIVAGYGCVFGRSCSGNMGLLQKYAGIYGYGVTAVPPFLVDGLPCSSSLVRACLRGGDVETANKVLGRLYRINGKVMKGLGRGKLVGFPTINLNITHVMLPKFGVYRARVRICCDDKWLLGIVNIGVRPTFCDTKFPILEMHIFNFDRDVYGLEVSVELIHFMRPEKRFSDMGQLIQQIRDDIAEAKCAEFNNY